MDVRLSSRRSHTPLQFADYFYLAWLLSIYPSKSYRYNVREMRKLPKYTKKELKKPDRLREAYAEFVIYLTKNATRIIIGFGIVGLGLIITFGSLSYLENQRLKANAIFAEALDSYTGSTAPEKLQDSLSKFLSLEKEYSGMGISKIALYYAAEANYKLEKYDDAIGLFERFLKSGIEDDLLLNAAFFNLGEAYIKKENWEKALYNFSKLDKEGNPYRTWARYYIGGCFEKLKKTQDAKRVYEELLKDSPDENLRLRIQEKLKMMFQFPEGN